MDYTTCMTVIIICLFAMGCLCCVWVICCGIALMETKYATTLENLTQKTAKASGSPLYQCSCHNTTLSLHEKLSPTPDNSIKIETNEAQSVDDQSKCKLSSIPISLSNLDVDGRSAERKSNLIT